jgi:class 3 adenylate cyclase
MDVGGWLRRLGFEQYEAAFRENEIDDTVLPRLTAEDLRELGVGSVGHRRKLLDAIAALRADASLKAPPSEHLPSIGRSAKDAAERRQLTVMFCDLVGSTALSARLDPEDTREIIGAYHRCCAEQITKAGGFVAKYMGDGVLAYFGYPQAHEDDAERAVRGALALIEAVPTIRTAQDVALQVRVGVATGVVVVGDLIGEGAAQEQGVVGETPNLAARLQALADPAQVVIAQSTRRITGGLFEYRDLGRVTLKGLAERTQAWQVIGGSTLESRFDAQHGAALTPLVGREEELELLLRRWQRAKAGEGSVLLVSGEPGIGKSRIVEALFERLGTEPYTRLRLFCSPHHQDAALYPTITQLERAAGFRRDDTDEQRLDKLEVLLARATNDLNEAAPLLAQLLSVPTEGRYPALDLSPQKRKERTFKALIAQVAGLAVRRPAVMVCEDVHWIDPTSLELLDLIVDQVQSLPMLLIITFRPEFTPSWVGRPQVMLLSLSRLPHRQAAEMLLRLTGGKPLPTEVADQIVDRTDGVPLFIEELTKAVVESGELADAGDHRGPRQHLHARIALALEERFPETAETQPELLAHHFTEAGRAERALSWWRRAGERARERSANLEAVRHLGKALDLLGSLPETPARLDEELALRMAIAVPLIATKGYASPEVETAYQAARDLCRRLGRPPADLFRALRGLWNCYAVRGELQRARNLAEELARLAEAQEQPLWRALSGRALGTSFYFIILAAGS